jgi:hypothetical protein
VYTAGFSAWDYLSRPQKRALSGRRTQRYRQVISTCLCCAVAYNLQKSPRVCKNPDVNFHTHKSQSLNTFLSLLLRIRILLKRLPSRVYICVTWDFVLLRASHASDSYITEQILWPLDSGQDIRCHWLCFPSLCSSSPFISRVLTQTRRYVAIKCTFTLFGRSHFGSYRALNNSACNQLVHTTTGLTEIPTWLSTDTFPRVVYLNK